MTGASKEAQVIEVTQEGKKVILDQVLYIHYPIQFWNDKRATIWALINSGSEFNAMNLAYPKKLGLQTQRTDVGAQKIDGWLLEIYGMVIAAFQVKDKLSRARFFQEIFLLADTSIEVILGIPFFAFNNVNIQFAEKKPTWRTYTIEDALLTTC